RQARAGRPRLRAGLERRARWRGRGANRTHLAVGRASLRLVLPELLRLVRRRDRRRRALRAARAGKLRVPVGGDRPGRLLAAVAHLARALVAGLRLHPARGQPPPPRRQRAGDLRGERRLAHLGERQAARPRLLRPAGLGRVPPLGPPQRRGGDGRSSARPGRSRDQPGPQGRTRRCHLPVRVSLLDTLLPASRGAASRRPDHAVSHGVARWHLVEKEGPLLRAPLPRRICRLALRPRARGRSGGSGEWRRPPGVRGAALAVVCAALAACGGSRTTPPKVVLIGIDGAEPSVLDRLRAAGRAPVLSRLIATGAAGSLATFRPTLSPALWTTVATGESPATHGVENFVTFRPQAELVLPELPAGDVEVRLRIVLEGPCGGEALQVHLDGTPLPGTWDASGLHVRPPAALGRGGGHVLLLRLPARCSAEPPGQREGPPWGRIAGVTVLGPSGTALADAGPQALVSPDRGIRAADEPGAPALLVGRRLTQVESGDRRVPALWNITTSRGRTVGVVGWWCTWPAERVQGTIFSDFLFFASTRRLPNFQRLPEDALQDGAVYPPEAARLFASTVPAGWEMSAEELARFVPGTSPRFAEWLRLPARVHSLGDPPLVVLKDTYLINRPYFGVARRLAAEAQPDLLP